MNKHNTPNTYTNSSGLPAALSVAETAERLRVGRNGVYALINEGRLRSIKVGRRRIVPVSALADFLDTSDSTGEVA